MSIDSSDWVGHGTQVMRNAGMRVTRALRGVLHVLDSAERPLRVEEIRQRGDFAPSELVTIYRNLERLQASDLVQRILLEDGVQLFEKSTPEHHHHHIVCRKCCKTEPLETCIGHELELQAARSGFSNVSHVIEVFGVCSECQDSRA